LDKGRIVDLLIIAIAIAVIAGAVIAFWIFRSSSSGAETSDATRPSSAPKAKPEVGLRSRLAKTRSALGAPIASLFRSGDANDGAWESLEDALILADVGPDTAALVVDEVRGRSPQDPEEAMRMLGETLIGLLSGRDRSLDLDAKPSTIVVVGVNGTGKTTSIAKLANALVADGKTIVLGAGDTYRAAADHQLKEWGTRVGVEVLTADQGSDPASVAFAAVDHAKNVGIDVVIVDTAGRLHSQTNLMEELTKVTRVVAREAGSVSEVLLVLDGTTGQNGITQARAFAAAVGVTGIVLTKLDGTAKGGIAIAVERELDIPIKYIGVGEGMDDLIPFVPDEFVEALITS
jgi:fused signal recognition particle receptor